MKTVYNFSAGPAVLPKSVLEKAQSELVNYENSGMSVMELSHRSSLFEAIIEDAETLLRELMNIPDNYKVLFLQGGASTQFTMVPLNLAQNKKALYVNTGSWAKKAISEAKKIDNVAVEVIASSEDQNFTYIPEIRREDIPQDAAYVHITTNNTIEGTTIYDLPDTGDVPIVADMSSNILSIDYNVADFGLIYAGAQKNIGPAGLTVVIVREDLIGQADVLSAMLDYDIHAKNGSMYNTPPTYSIYMAKLVFEWIKEHGGVSQMEKQNKEKAALLYDEIEASSLFSSPVVKKDRSINNIPFVTEDEVLDKKFNQEALAAGFENLKGHRSVGGMRASLYNAFPKAGVEALVTFMKKFEAENGGTN
ncbi:3-phosphoserine/phosphohydroxythreonine transaminase [Enterococcus sp. DIV0242_7C1]|uniref:Phosphoserine aminotransferase n=1 Tax=Candidatus Enterococcus dunnyi TaxID=1834192 RepID=A0A200IZB4_9ENTE|nr:MULTISPECIES: 3-phosphoserine/phosphohydroxythreonine transaminase [unclassified Enterococcus]MBO0470319.1 3-phosphoserine/phosphohydroxythreonine transaminase [Enterococcus sp. DIV0242_7C1]OUZ30312.1 phosphoserine aminotransferase [Enterococcus sp. 9D6_DIV0238]